MRQQQAPVQLSVQHSIVWLILIKQGTNKQWFEDRVYKKMRSYKPVATTLSQMHFYILKFIILKLFS